MDEFRSERSLLSNKAVTVAVKDDSPGKIDAQVNQDSLNKFMNYKENDVISVYQSYIQE